MKTTLLFLLVLSSGRTFSKDFSGRISSNQCLECHQKEVSEHSYYNSVHKDISCTACHIRDEHATQLNNESAVPAKPKQCVAVYKEMDCGHCHSQVSKDYVGSVHNSMRLQTTCWKCHQEIHSIQSNKGNKQAIAKQCSRCHSKQEGYFNSSHYASILKGSSDAATCTDCHGTHSVAKVDNDFKGRQFHTKVCLQCHANQKLMTKHEVTTTAASTYFNSYHGKNVRLGYPEKVAGCADCHGSHAILKAKDPHSKVNSKNLLQTCTKCHQNATPSFTKYATHGDDGDSKNYPALYWTRIAMTTLLVGTFLFFWLHSILWAFRAYVEKHARAKEHAFGVEKQEQKNPAVAPHALKDAKRLYRRFRLDQIIMHLVVIISFLGLSLTGLPLKFNNTIWGKTLIDLIGGTARAGMIHRICAILTFTYFFAAIAMSLKFLFIDKKIKGNWLTRLLGPDSLFPNMRDIKDFQAMLKWFFFKGPKPSFERWTYWEKFDFLAVFWGMFAIGSSGLVLWFPEMFGRILPGWIFNLATIIHSDEALLATGFIFTVHFFNTHVRPEKFPMDFVIFNGEITKEEMINERADQWQRYEREGRTDDFLIKKPSSVLWDITFRIFGFFAVLIGLSLFVGIIIALLSQN